MTPLETLLKKRPLKLFSKINNSSTCLYKKPVPFVRAFLLEVLSKQDLSDLTSNPLSIHKSISNFTCYIDSI